MANGTKCEVCGQLEADHFVRDFMESEGYHPFKVKPGDEWCEECDDFVVNGCGSLAACESEAEDREIDRANDAWLNDRPASRVDE